MRFLIDKSPADVNRKATMHPLLIGGQLLTPLTRYANAGGIFAIDNGAFSGFRHECFSKLMEREKGNVSKCLFVAVPDVVGSARRTLEIYMRRHSMLDKCWPTALVAQDGIEDLVIPWDDLQAIFIGGGDPWKDSKAALDVVRTAKTLGKHVHVGRVNTAKRYKLFTSVGADTCDGSGVAMYDYMLDDIAREITREPEPTLFDAEEQPREIGVSA